MSPKKPNNENFISNSLFVELIGLSYTLFGTVERNEKGKHRKEMVVWKTNFPGLVSRRKKTEKTEWREIINWSPQFLVCSKFVGNGRIGGKRQLYSYLTSHLDFVATWVFGSAVILLPKSSTPQ